MTLEDEQLVTHILKLLAVDKGYEWQSGHCAREDGNPMEPPDDCDDRAAWIWGWKALDQKLKERAVCG